MSDSMFVWGFRSAATGDVWTGTLYADSTLYDAGQVVPASGGFYYIAAETPYAVDLSDWFAEHHGEAAGAMYEDGKSYVTGYHPAETLGSEHGMATVGFWPASDGVTG